MCNICNNLFVSMTGGYLKKNNFSHLNNLSNIYNGTFNTHMVNADKGLIISILNQANYLDVALLNFI